jgi:DUF4097 and DUF4098 domain-containing protein YvlB
VRGRPNAAATYAEVVDGASSGLRKGMMGNMSKEAQWCAITVALLALTAFAADQRKEFRYTVAPGASVRITNESGPVDIRGSSGRQVVIVTTAHSDKVEVDSNQTGNRVDAFTHFLQHADGPDAKVDYQVVVPQDARVTVRAPGGPITAEKLRGDVTLEGDAAQMDVRDVNNAHVHLRTISGPISLSNITNGHVEITTLSGNVRLDSVTGPKVSVNTSKGSIFYNGDFGAAGDYMLVNHSGDIEVTLPSYASVDLSARSISGSVQNDFPLEQSKHPLFPIAQGRSFAGTSNAGASSVQLRSFSGKIRVKKQ